LLLSDGLANVGITEPAQLKEIARRQFQENRIGLSSFGVVADFNEELMMQLSEYGGANYYFIETPDQIPQIFAKELQGLLSVVAQNTNLEIEFPSEFLKVEKV
jgi:Ca-activated chloride channel family protein